MISAAFMKDYFPKKPMIDLKRVPPMRKGFSVVTFSYN